MERGRGRAPSPLLEPPLGRNSNKDEEVGRLERCVTFLSVPLKSAIIVNGGAVHGQSVLLVGNTALCVRVSSLSSSCLAL